MKPDYNVTLKTLLVVLLMTGIFTDLSAQSQNEQIEVFLRYKMKSLGIPGLQYAIIKHGKIVNSGALGLANIELHVPVTNQTVFSIASATKCFTGIAVTQLAEEGMIDLSAPVSKYLDSLPAVWQPVTIRQLLTHTSGIPNIVDPTTSEMIVKGIREAWTKVQTLPMEFQPGERFSYNQTNYLLLGKIIDKVTGKPFSQLIAGRQFNVIGMPLTARSGFEDTYGIVMGSASLYTNETDSLQHNFLYVVPPVLRTGSGISSTAVELAHWIIGLQKGELFKSKNTLRTLWKPSVLNNGKLNGWALGWVVRNRADHFAVGGYGGNRSAFFVYPQDDLAVIILTNMAGCQPETFIDQLAGYYIPDMLVSNGFGLSPAIKPLHEQLLKKGFNQAIAITAELMKRDTSFHLSQNDLNKWGYAFLEEGKIKEALEIFKLNVSLYPEGGNTYDSLAETYMAIGNKDLAIKNYERAFELNPKNTNAVDQLRKLRQK